MKTTLATFIAILLTAGLVYSATLLAIRFQDMSNKIERVDACRSQYDSTMPKASGK